MSSSRDDFSIAIRSALLQRGTRQKFSLFFLICLATIIFFLDTYKFGFVSIVRSIINDGVYKISSVSNAPINLFGNTVDSIKSIIFVHQENKRLNEELENLRFKNFNNEFLIQQNRKLQKTLESKSNLLQNNVVAKVLLDKDSPYLKSIIINRGSKSGIKKGMPVLDDNYLVGRVVETNYLSSRVLLLNDLNSRIPVVLNDENVQAILTGEGKKNPKLDYLPEMYEPKENINIFTSGKDGIFMQGIPVGKTLVENDSVEVKLFSDPNQLSFVNVQLIELKKEF